MNALRTASVADMGLGFVSPNLTTKQQLMHGAGTTRHYARAKPPRHASAPAGNYVEEDVGKNEAEGDEYENEAEGDEYYEGDEAEGDEDNDYAVHEDEEVDLEGKSYLNENPDLFAHDEYVALREEFNELNADDIVHYKVPASTQFIADRVRTEPKFARYRANVIARLENLAKQHRINLLRTHDTAAMNVAIIHSIIAHNARMHGVLNFVKYNQPPTDDYEDFPASLIPRCILQWLATGKAPAILTAYVKKNEAKQQAKYERQQEIQQEKFMQQLRHRDKHAARARGGRGRGNGSRVLVGGRGGTRGGSAQGGNARGGSAQGGSTRGGNAGSGNVRSGSTRGGTRGGRGGRGKSQQ